MRPPRLPSVRAALLAPILVLALCCSAPAAPQATLVMDARTGEVLLAENADTRLHPASLTKMMTLYLAFAAAERGEVDLDASTTVSARAAGETGSRLGLREGHRIALRHLVRAVAVNSANDAATALAEAISGDEAAFVARMNEAARAMGLTGTTFANAHGLTEAGHLSTARDMSALARRLRFDFPGYWGLFSLLEADAGLRRVAHTNRRFLSGYSGADGVKTGYTRAAGFNLAASAVRGDRWVIVTVFGAPSSAARAARVARLMDTAFAGIAAEAEWVPPPPLGRPGPAPDAAPGMLMVAARPLAEAWAPGAPAVVATLPSGLGLPGSTRSGDMPTAGGVSLSGLAGRWRGAGVGALTGSAAPRRRIRAVGRGVSVRPARRVLRGSSCGVRPAGAVLRGPSCRARPVWGKLGTGMSLKVRRQAGAIGLPEPRRGPGRSEPGEAARRDGLRRSGGRAHEPGVAP